MLSRIASCTALAVGLFVTGAVPASAGEHVVCPPGGTVCYIVVDEPGSPATRSVSGGRRGVPECHEPNSTTPTPCYDRTFGWFSNADGCYFHRVDPPPPSTDPVWEGHFPEGTIYQATCLGVSGFGGGWVWRPTAPPGFGGGAGTAARLADEAIAQLDLTGPDIGFAPNSGRTGLVGLPVWMWTRVSASTWGPTTASASLPGISVSATAQATKIVWDMGDGRSVTCDGPGTPYSEDAAETTSPTCGYVYLTSSAGHNDDAFQVLATTTWEISWAGGGTSGQVTQTRSSSLSVRIGELQVLVT